MSVLQRKAQVGKQEHQARAMTVPKALRVTLAKVADQSFGMALAVIGVAKEQWAGDEIEAQVPENDLLLLMDGPSGITGGVVLEAPLVSALVQQQTTGRVSNAAPQSRKMTATDAALCAPLLETLFVRANGLLETAEDRASLPCFKFGARAENRRLFALAMEEAEYRVLRLTVDIAAGIAQSTMTLILPVVEARPEVEPEDDTSRPVKKAATLEASVMGLQAELSAVLCRMRLSLSDIGALRPGIVFPISTEAFDKVELLSVEGRVVGTGAMGQVDGNRALMLSGGADTRASGGGEGEREISEAETSDYSTLNLPDLDIPSGPEMTLPGSELPDLPDLPELPAVEEATTDAAPDMADLSPLPDLPDLAGGLPDLPDLDGELPDLGELPQFKTA